MSPAGVRLDQLLTERGLAPSRERARALILAGRVRVGGKRVEKAGTRIPLAAQLDVMSDPNPYVSRGGLKMAAALAGFGISPAGWVVLDVGASTGGFSDCLLKKGARQVIALDVGHGQLDWGLRQDPRVLVVERCNARDLSPDLLKTRLPAWETPLDFAVVDVSFISLGLILPALSRFAELSRVVCLVKPQFEAGRRQVGRGGIVRDPAVHAEVLLNVAHTAQALGWQPRDLLPSPITGAGGNREFLIHLQRLPGSIPDLFLQKIQSIGGDNT
jgi:23S rRNA (cytidine1920-2'-O)/16S rRNA (cytidine1409-2'-O)-methyltransferase